MSRIDVFYGRTDNTRGYKEYSCVVVQTSETDRLTYYDDLYEPQRGCNYKVLYEVPMSRLGSLCSKAGVETPHSVDWVKSPLKEVVLEEFKKYQEEAKYNRAGRI